MMVILAGLAKSLPRREIRAGILVADQTSIEREVSVDQAKKPITATFKLKNHGDTDVKIIRINSSCSCSKATAKADVVVPGSTCDVEVSANALAVGTAEATVTIQTDSPDSPTIPLHFKVKTARKVPFLLQGGGELIFSSNSKLGDSRDLIIMTMESSEADKQKPTLSVDLPYFSIDSPTETTTLVGEVINDSKDTTTVFKRTYTYQVKLKSRPSAGVRCTGLVTISDPWDSSNIIKEVIQLEPFLPLKISPSHLVFRFDDESKSYRPLSGLVSAYQSIKISLLCEEPNTTAPGRAPLILLP